MSLTLTTYQRRNSVDTLGFNKAQNLFVHLVSLLTDNSFHLITNFMELMKGASLCFDGLKFGTTVTKNN